MTSTVTVIHHIGWGKQLYCYFHCI